jgi:hypothetical protein
MVAHEETLTGLVDPFSDAAANARYPDSGAGRTLTFQQRQTFLLGTDANGIISLVVTPKFNFTTLYQASAAGQVVTWPATYSALGDTSTSLINTYGTAARPTSIGVRISNTLSATDAAGYLVIAKGGPPTVSSTTTFNPSNFSSYDIHPYEHGEEWHTVAAPRGDSAYVMVERAAFDSNTDVPLQGWESIYIALFGSKAGVTAGIVEIYTNYEYVASEDAPIAQLAVRQPVLNVGMQTAINEVQSAHQGSHKGGTHIVKAFLKKEGKKALLKHVLPFVTKKATQLLL